MICHYSYTAKLEEKKLSDGSFVYNLIVKETRSKGELFFPLTETEITRAIIQSQHIINGIEKSTGTKVRSI